MRVAFDPEFMEQAVLLAVRQNPALERRLHKLRDPIYTIAEEHRSDSFARLHRSFFERLRLDEPVAAVLAECPQIGEKVECCLVRSAANRKAEGTELFIKQPGDRPDHRTLLIQVCPSSLLDVPFLKARLRRDVLHVEDMLSEGFGYASGSLLGHSPQQNLIRDRYRVLWDVFVEGRLHRRGLGDGATLTRLRTQFHKAFGGGPPCESVFQGLFETLDLTHGQLLDIAKAQPFTGASARPSSLSSPAAR